MRRLRQPSTANRFAVHAIQRGARELITVDAATLLPGGRFLLWGVAQDRVDQGDRPFTSADLGDCKPWKAHPPIVRLLPPAGVSDEAIAVVRKAFEAVGAHVRVLAREKGQSSAVEAAEAPSEPASFAGIRETVEHVLEHEVKSVNPAALKSNVEQTMLRCGL